MSADAAGVGDFKSHTHRFSGQEQSSHVVRSDLLCQPDTLYPYRHVGVRSRAGEDADGLLDDLRSPPDALQLALPVEELHDDVNCRAHPGTCPRTPFPALCPRWRHVLRGSHFLAMPDSGEQETEIEYLWLWLGCQRGETG